MFPFALAASLIVADLSPALSLRLTEDATAIEVVGLNAADLRLLREANLADAFRVAVSASTPPLLGSFTTTALGPRFEPRFPFVPGTTYLASFRWGTHAVNANLRIPQQDSLARTTVTAVYPSADQLPENTLRLYVQFSGPMDRKDIYRHLSLTSEGGKKVELPFLELDEQLWSVDGTRLTLLFDPGRVKRGLLPREEEGPILEEGWRYTFTIDRDWEDVHGRTLRSSFRKSFVAGPPDDMPVDPICWSMMAPRKGTADPLILRLAKPLDHALLNRLVWATDAAGRRVEGIVAVGGGERVVTFAAAKPWAEGIYHLVVDTRLEDVCGNRVGEPFEVDEFQPLGKKLEAKTISRDFVVR